MVEEELLGLPGMVFRCDIVPNKRGRLLSSVTLRCVIQAMRAVSCNQSPDTFKAIPPTAPINPANIPFLRPARPVTIHALLREPEIA